MVDPEGSAGGGLRGTRHHHDRGRDPRLHLAEGQLAACTPRGRPAAPDAAIASGRPLRPGALVRRLTTWRASGVSLVLRTQPAMADIRENDTLEQSPST